MDCPLGVNTCPIVNVEDVQTWGNTEVPIYDCVVNDPSGVRQPPFVYAPDLNEKITFWDGDITRLNSEAIINPTNETLTDKNHISLRIHARAGPQLKSEIKHEVKACKTGEAKLTKGYDLPARYVIHTVGPRYNLRYKTAAENALFNSYRNILKLAKDHKIASLAIPCIHCLKRSYPSYEGAHIALRTVRRFLEHHGHLFDKVIFVTLGDDVSVYSSLLPLYFPRNEDEELFSSYHLPYDIGNAIGEPIIEERQIRITGKPTHNFSAFRSRFYSEESPLEQTCSVDINEVFNMSVAVGAHPFAQMDEEFDKYRKEQVIGKIIAETNIIEQKKRYEKWLNRSKQEDLNSIDQQCCFYQSGFDKHNRPVMIFISKLFDIDQVEPEKAIMYFIQQMDPVVKSPYIILYVHSDNEKKNFDTEFSKSIYNLVDFKYRKNLNGFYILHASFWSKVKTWFTTTFHLYSIKDRVLHIPGLEYLYSRIPADQLKLPDFVLDYDIKVNGTRYYNHEHDEAIGDL